MDEKRLVDGTTALAEKQPRKMCGCGLLPTLVSAQTPKINSIPLLPRTATIQTVHVHHLYIQ